MGKITKVIGLTGLAALTGILFTGGANATRLSDAGIITVIGTSDAGMCVRATERDDLSEAMYWCTRTIRRGESNMNERAVAYMHRGVLHLKAGDNRRARADLDEAIRLTPHYGDAHFNKGNLLFREGKLADAVKAYDMALANPITTPELVHYNRSRAYSRLGQADKAKADMDQARSLMPPESPLRQRLSSVQ